MAKSKKKTNKSKKSNKTTKKVQSVKQVKQLEKSNQSQILVGVVISFSIALVIGALLIGTAEDKSIKSSAKPTTNPNSQQTIEVVEPDSSGTPKSSGYTIQGSSPEGQEAQGGLQTPSTDPLQPNARINDYENAQLN